MVILVLDLDTYYLCFVRPRRMECRTTYVSHSSVLPNHHQNRYTTSCTPPPRGLPLEHPLARRQAVPAEAEEPASAPPQPAPPPRAPPRAVRAVPLTGHTSISKISRSRRWPLRGEPLILLGLRARPGRRVPGRGRAPSFLIPAERSLRWWRSKCAAEIILYTNRTNAMVFLVLDLDAY